MGRSVSSASRLQRAAAARLRNPSGPPHRCCRPCRSPDTTGSWRCRGWCCRRRPTSCCRSSPPDDDPACPRTTAKTRRFRCCPPCRSGHRPTPRRCSSPLLPSSSGSSCRRCKPTVLPNGSGLAKLSVCVASALKVITSSVTPVAVLLPLSVPVFTTTLMLNALLWASTTWKAPLRLEMLTGALNRRVSSDTCECWLELPSLTTTVSCGAQLFGPPTWFNGCPPKAVLVVVLRRTSRCCRSGRWPARRPLSNRCSW